MSVLVTGGAGFVGSHACVELLQAGYDLLVLDNFVNSRREALSRVEEIAAAKLRFEAVDICDAAALDRVFSENEIDAVVHLAGLKSIRESVADPGLYYRNNVGGSLALFDAMAGAGVFDIVFSSSATVYGDPARFPISEDFPLVANNPYGRCKLMIENILRDLHVADARWNAILLRYFNPVGAHESGLIGEDPHGIPNNLMPYISQVAVGRREFLPVFGNDYETRDGTGIRDYIHVVDLAAGHLQALRALDDHDGVSAYNLGTGRGYSVLEVVAAFEKATGKSVPCRIVERRPGDAAECFADVSLARRELGWQARRGIDRMALDSWNWQSRNPSGYRPD